MAGPRALSPELDALASPRRPPQVLVGAAAAACLNIPGTVVEVADRELTRAAREGGWAVVATKSLPATLVRVFLKDPPLLVIVTGAAELDALAALRGGGIRVLGPHARLSMTADVLDARAAQVIATALWPAELDALRNAQGDTSVELCPTPTWLPSWVRDLNAEAIGWVNADELTADWEVMAGTGNHVLVPLGVPNPSLEASFGAPADADLDRAAIAQALERRTGPLYPAPRVIALVFTRGDSSADEPPVGGVQAAGQAGARVVWEQARRALPHLGARLGMSEPRAGLSLDVPAAAFLAQRALLRIERHDAIARREPTGLPAVDADARARADEVMRASAVELSEHESKVVLRGFGFEITRQAVATSASGAAQFAERIGFPVVLKAVSPDLRRKHELGLVRLDLPTAAAVRRAHAQIQERAEREAPTARIDGVIVAEMIQPGLEVRCGIIRAASGRAVVYAQPQGPGLWAPLEPLFAYLPLSPIAAALLADRALERVPAPAMRRATDPDPDVLAEVLLRLSHLVSETGERLVSVDLSPVRLINAERRYVVLDARIAQRPHLEGD